MNKQPDFEVGLYFYSFLPSQVDYFRSSFASSSSASAGPQDPGS